MKIPPVRPDSAFESRVLVLQRRVNEAAQALHAQGLKPTVARIRAALGGGSPNDLSPALKHWKERVLPTLSAPVGADQVGPVPPPIADLAREIWIRAVAAAQIESRGGEAALKLVARSEETGLLRQQVASLQDEIAKDAIAYGEVRQLAARHEAVAKHALEQVRDSVERERRALISLGEAKQQIAVLEAAIASVKQVQGKRATPKRKSKPSPPAKSKRTIKRAVKKRPPAKSSVIARRAKKGRRHR